MSGPAPRPSKDSHTHSPPSTSHSPPKGTISVDYSERVKGRVHHLSCGEEILNHRHTQVGQQQTQEHRGWLADVVTCGGGVKDREKRKGGGRRREEEEKREEERRERRKGEG